MTAPLPSFAELFGRPPEAAAAAHIAAAYAQRTGRSPTVLLPAPP